MKRTALLLLLVLATIANAHVTITGRLIAPEYPGAEKTVPIMAVYCFANLAGSQNQALGFRTWETYPAGWYFMPGSPGRYSVMFSDPAGYARPLAMTNIYTVDGDKIDRAATPAFDYADFYQGQWDTKPAAGYYQTFTARGTSITSVGFKLATDGVDGQGPEGQNILISVHRKTDGTPDKWPQVGPTAVVLDVDCGGAKNYWWSAGFNSGQVPTTPGDTYAVYLHSEKPDNSFQAFWRPVEDGQSDCYRMAKEGETGWQRHNLCMTIASDSDGLVIPVNKCVHKKFGEFAGFDHSWAQTYVAKGHSLASVILFAAASGTQPSMNRQRVKVRVHEGSPDGPLVGIEKIAIGNGNYTGDASWGTYGLSYEPGEVPLEPGKTYAIEFTSIENYNTLHGFVNIKGQVSDDRAGFNPYRKNSRDSYDGGTAYRQCKDKQPFDLDLQVIEYANEAGDWANAVTGDELVTNGEFSESPIPTGDPNAPLPPEWEPFKIDRDTILSVVTDPPANTNRIARISGGKTADGGFVQLVTGLSPLETYRLSAKLRCTWHVDDKHAAMIGYDTMGRTSDLQSDTIHWTALPTLTGQFVDYTSDPIRPEADRIAIYLRARTIQGDGYPFKADFDSVTLKQIATSTPTP